MSLTGRPIYQKGQRPGVSKVIRNASAGQTCTLQIPGVCNQNPETVVGCHLRMMGVAGMAQKPDDVFLVDACSDCHALLDNRAAWDDAPIGYDDILRAFIITLKRRRASGLILLVGEK